MVLKATLAALPDIEALRKLTQSLAMLDAIMSPEWEHRYYSFNSTWGRFHNVLKIRPPMPFSETDADLFLATLDRILAEGLKKTNV